MQVSVDNTSDISGLSATERLLLAQQLLDSVLNDVAPLTPEQDTEIERRIRDIDTGKSSCKPWDEVYARLSRHA